ncbi:MAG TPA: endonuclease [Salinimicrobium sp.]|nr:endonuclease [Salinimicrobium sp.]
MKKLLPLLLFVPFFAMAQQPYYDDVNLSLNGMDLFEELSIKVTVTHTNQISYSGVWNASKITDEDPNNSQNVLLIYGYNDSDGDSDNDRSRSKNLNGGNAGDWNREHVYAKSLGTPDLGTSGPGSDAHHLRPSDVNMNGDRGNRKFASGSGNAGTTGSNWYPGDEWKGDVARMLMYMYLRYGSQTLPDNVAIGVENTIDDNMVDLLLEWNAEDPVSEIEDQRNTYHDSDGTYAQGNRNPFIDNPFLATRIWGGPPAQDRWNNSDDDEAPSAPLNLTASNVTEYTVDLTWDASTDNVGVSGYSIYVDGDYVTSTTATSITISDLNPQTTYTIVVYATDAAGNTSVASNQVEITTLEGPTYLINEDFNDCSTVPTNFFPYSQTSEPYWQCKTQYGEDNTGSYEMNAYSDGATVPGIDWLITSHPLNFDEYANELLSFYTDASFGDTKLELLYSTDYDETGNAEDYTWIPVPNVDIPIHSGSSGEEIFTFDNIDVSSITGEVYMAFRYDTDGGAATRWTVDNFQIVGEEIMGVGSNDLLDFTVYPNPSINGRVNISLPNSNQVEITLYSISGKRILSKEESVINSSITLENLPTGLFFLKISSDGKTATKKIVVQ